MPLVNTRGGGSEGRASAAVVVDTPQRTKLFTMFSGQSSLLVLQLQGSDEGLTPASQTVVFDSFSKPPSPLRRCIQMQRLQPQPSSCTPPLFNQQLPRAVSTVSDSDM
jgi:hypothetical protein